MSLLERMPWIQAHLDLYKRDPVKGHDFQGPGHTEPKPTLLLTTTGRKTGEKRQIPLIYGKAGGNFIIIASLGGAPKHPSWYVNLQAHPDAEIQVRAEHYKVRARDAQGVERQELWALMAKILPQYDEYARRAAGKREIPVVVLEPI